MIGAEVIITNPHSRYYYMGGKIIEISRSGCKVKMNGTNEEIWFFLHEVGEVVGHSNQKEG